MVIKRVPVFEEKLKCIKGVYKKKFKDKFTMEKSSQSPHESTTTHCVTFLAKSSPKFRSINRAKPSSKP